MEIPLPVLFALLFLGVIGALALIYLIYKSLLTNIMKEYAKEIKKSKAH